MNLSFEFLRVVGIGCPTATTRNNSTPFDFIEFFEKRSTRIFDIVGPLYRKGLSITDIADQTGLKRHSIWKALQVNKQELRPQASISFERWRQGNGKTKARPPFGFCYFDGTVVKDPAEYPTLILIRNLKKQGHSISSIVSTLNGKRIKTRMKRKWNYNVVKSIMRRIDDGSLGHLTAQAEKSKSNSNSKRGE